jgi:putative aminopeptidase FrvX
MSDFLLLQELCSIHAPSGNEGALTSYILEYVQKNSFTWKRKPRVYAGIGFQDAVVLVFGSPRTAIFAHIDSVGFTVGYDKELLPIGSPKADEGTQLVGSDSLGDICCSLQYSIHECHNDDGSITEEKICEYVFSRDIERGTTLTYKPKFTEDDKYIISPFLDNRAGVWCALKLAETLENGVIVFSTYEEHKGGSVPFLQRFLYKKYHIRQALIADITWVTKGILFGNGCVVSLRDSYIPRRTYVQRIIDIIRRSQLPFQCEVEKSGGSDGGYLQVTPYAVDWCFVGAPQEFSHTPHEKIYKDDLYSMLLIYKVLMKEL